MRDETSITYSANRIEAGHQAAILEVLLDIRSLLEDMNTKQTEGTGHFKEINERLGVIELVALEQESAAWALRQQRTKKETGR